MISVMFRLHDRVKIEGENYSIIDIEMTANKEVILDLSSQDRVNALRLTFEKRRGDDDGESRKRAELSSPLPTALSARTHWVREPAPEKDKSDDSDS